MIQRIQSVYLALAAVLMLSLLFFDLPWTSPAAADFGWFTPVLLALPVILAVGIVATIFLYGNRQRQKRYVEILQYAVVAFMVLLYGAMYAAGDLHFARDGATSAGKVAAMIIPVLAYVLLFLARQGISRDIALVRSMDRLR